VMWYVQEDAEEFWMYSDYEWVAKGALRFDAGYKHDTNGVVVTGHIPDGTNSVTVTNETASPKTAYDIAVALRTLLAEGAGGITITAATNAFGQLTYTINDDDTIVSNALVSLIGSVSNDLDTAKQDASANLDTWSGVAPSANGQSLVAAANYAAMRTLLDLEAGTDFLAYSSFSANGISLVGAANYAAMRALLDLEAGTDFYSKSAEDTWRSNVSQTEMGYLDGATSDIQTQLNAKMEDLVDDASPTLGAVLDSAGYGSTNWREQVTLVATNTDYTLTRSDSGKVFTYTGTGDVLFDLPAGNTSAHLGQKFTFINTTTNLLKLNADCAIDNSDSGGDAYELYSGSGTNNLWPWSSCTVILAESNWWHVADARGDWTTTGTDAPTVPLSPYMPQTSTNDIPTVFTPRYVGDRLIIYSNTNRYYVAFGTTTNDWDSIYDVAP